MINTILSEVRRLKADIQRGEIDFGDDVYTKGYVDALKHIISLSNCLEEERTRKFTGKER